MESEDTSLEKLSFVRHAQEFEQLYAKKYLCQPQIEEDKSGCLRYIRTVRNPEILRHIATAMHRQKEFLDFIESSLRQTTDCQKDSPGLSESLKNLLDGCSAMQQSCLHDDDTRAQLEQMHSFVFPLFKIHSMITQYIQVIVKTSNDEKSFDELVQNCVILTSWYEKNKQTLEDFYNQVVGALIKKVRGMDLYYRLTAWGEPEVALKPFKLAPPPTQSKQAADAAYEQLMAELDRKDARTKKTKRKQSLCVGSPKSTVSARSLAQEVPPSPLSACADEDTSDESDDDSAHSDNDGDDNNGVYGDIEPETQKVTPYLNTVSLRRPALRALIWHQDPIQALKLHEQEDHNKHKTLYRCSRVQQIRTIVRHRLPLILEQELQSWATVSYQPNHRNPSHSDLALSYDGFIQLSGGHRLDGKFLILVNPLTCTPFHRFFHLGAPNLADTPDMSTFHVRTIERKLAPDDYAVYTVSESPTMVQITDSSDRYHARYVITRPTKAK